MEIPWVRHRLRRCLSHGVTYRYPEAYELACIPAVLSHGTDTENGIRSSEGARPAADAVTRRRIERHCRAWLFVHIGRVSLRAGPRARQTGGVRGTSARELS
jgi:hypothetical protein